MNLLIIIFNVAIDNKVARQQRKSRNSFIERLATR